MKFISLAVAAKYTHACCDSAPEGDAVGDGVVRQCFSNIMHQNLISLNCLTPVYTDSYKSIQPPSFFDDFEHLLNLKVLGTLAVLHIVQVGVGPEPISPVLLQAVLAGINTTLDDEDWLRIVDPDTMAVIDLLPQDRALTRGQFLDLTGSERFSLKALCDMHAKTIQVSVSFHGPSKLKRLRN